MASAKIQDLRSNSMDELRTELLKIQRALFGLRTQISNQASENTAGLGKLKREIAQVKTVLREKVGADAMKEDASK